MTVTPTVHVRRSRFWATNTTIVVGAEGCLLADPGVYPDELAATAAMLPGPALAAVHTHAHWDHVLWSAAFDHLVDRLVDQVGPVPRFVTGGTRTYLDRTRGALLHQLREVAAGREPGVDAVEGAGAARWELDHAGLGDPLPDGAAVPWAGPTALLLETDAHLPGHGSLHLPELGLLLAGDLVSDVDVPFPYWADPTVEPVDDRDHEGIVPYRRALDRLAALPHVTRVVPGHGTPTDRAGFLHRIDADRRYLERLEAIVASAVSEAEALARAATLPDDRLADPLVRSGHVASVRSWYSAAISSRPADPGR